MSDGNDDFQGKPWTAGAGYMPSADALRAKRPPLPAIEIAARNKFAQQVRARVGSNRTVEGSFNTDTMKWEPTVREDLGNDPPRPASPRRFKAWNHIYRLCMRALDGHDVPPDIAKYRDELWGPVHEKVYVEAVDAALKKESDEHERQQKMKAKRERLLAEAAVKESRENRIREAEERVEKYDETIAEHRREIASIESKIKAVETRKKRAQRSIRMLKRYEEKEKES